MAQPSMSGARGGAGGLRFPHAFKMGLALGEAQDFASDLLHAGIERPAVGGGLGLEGPAVCTGVATLSVYSPGGEEELGRERRADGDEHETDANDGEKLGSENVHDQRRRA